MADQELLRNLEDAAIRFRSAIERCDRRRLPEWFEDFPEGCCGDTAELLARYLSESGFGRFRYVCGVRTENDGQFCSHAWLAQGNLTVDITADQFPEVGKPVLVTTDPRWYRTFTVNAEHEADYQSDPHAKRLLDHAYDAIRSYIMALPNQLDQKQR